MRLRICRACRDNDVTTQQRETPAGTMFVCATCALDIARPVVETTLSASVESFVSYSPAARAALARMS
jgi:hypothetical protein